jgi:hypothetical protein
MSRTGEGKISRSACINTRGGTTGDRRLKITAAGTGRRARTVIGRGRRTLARRARPSAASATVSSAMRPDASDCIHARIACAVACSSAT